jgi:hypothetical protein
MARTTETPAHNTLPDKAAEVPKNCCIAAAFVRCGSEGEELTLSISCPLYPPLADR